MQNISEIIKTLQNGLHILFIEDIRYQDLNEKSLNKLTRAIEKSSKLTTINIDGKFCQRFKQKDSMLNTLVESISKCQTLKEIDFINLNINLEQTKRLADIPTLSKVSIANSDVDDARALALLKSPYIKILNLMDNQISPEIASELKSAFAKNNVEQLLLEQNNLTSRMSKEIIEANSKKLTQLFISFEKLTHEDENIIEQALKANTTITSLNFKTSQLTHIMRIFISRNLGKLDGAWSEVAILLNQEPLTNLKELFVKIGFDPNTLWPKSKQGNNPIINCWIANEYDQVVLKFIELTKQTLNPELRDFEEKTALITAAEVYGMREVVFKLLETFKDKIDVNAQDIKGRTALHFACAYKDTPVIRALIEHGAKKDIKDKAGLTAEDYLKFGEEQIRNLLIEIEIDPSRDANALANHLCFALRRTDFTKYSAKEWDMYRSIPVTHANIKNLLDTVFKNLKDNSNSQKLVDHDRILIPAILEMQKKLAKKSVLEFCLENTKEAEEAFANKQVDKQSTKPPVSVRFTIQEKSTLKEAASIQATPTQAAPAQSFLYTLLTSWKKPTT